MSGTALAAPARTVQPMKTLLAIDGNSLTHRAYHAMAGTNLRDSSGRPTWAIKGFLNLLIAAVDRVNADAVVIAFDDPHNSVRRTGYPAYKAGRSEKPQELKDQLALLPELLRDAGITVLSPDGLEADDVTAAAARAVADTESWRCIIATSDRDAFSHISDRACVLRILNGGIENSPILNQDRFHTMTGLRPDQYLDYAALRGDSSDNLPGVSGVGEKTATKLLAGFGSATAMWNAVSGDPDKVVEVAGKAALNRLRADGAHDAWVLNRQIMSADLSVHLDPDTMSALPLPAGPLAAALMTVSLTAGVRDAEAALCRQSAPVAAAAPQRTVDLEPPYDPEYDGVPTGYASDHEYDKNAPHPAAAFVF